MRKLVVGLLLLGSAAVLAFTLRPARAQTPLLLTISGLEIAGAKPVCLVRLTNTSPHAADVFSVHYTVRDTSQGFALSQPAAGQGAQLAPGKTLELDLGKIVAGYRAGFDVGPFTGPVQFVAFGEDGFFREFAPDTIHVEVEQTEGAVVRDAAVQWFVQSQ